MIEMEPILVAVKCPLPNFDGVTVHYNLMASDNDLRAFTRTAGREYGPVIGRVDGWPAGMAEPWSGDAPLAFRAWAANQGIAQAFIQFANDPNWMTA